MKNLLKSTLIGLLIGTQAYAGLPPTTTKGANDASKVTIFNMAFPGSPVVHSGITAYVPTPPSGGKTYISNGDFESNSTTGWTLCNTTLTGTLPTGTITNTASSFNALSTTNSSPLAGSYSLSVSSAGATTAGQGLCSSTFTIDAEDSTVSPHVQTITASYSGTANMNFSGTSSNTWAAYVYDVTNSQWIQPSGVYNFVGDGKLVATFQPNKTSSQYRLALLNVNASSGAIAMLWDSFSVGPQAVQKGPAISDWQSYTPTFSAGFGTVTGINVWYRRNADSLELFGHFTTGTTASSSATMSLPPGLKIEPTKVAASGITNIGRILRNLSGGSSSGDYANVMLANAADLTSIYFGTSNNTIAPSSIQNANSVFAANEVQFIQFAKIPIAGWSSNSVQSSDTDTRVTAAIASGNPQATYTANTPIILPTVLKDTHGAYSTSTGQYTAPVSGFYHVSAFFNTNAAQNSQLSAYVGGTQQYFIGFIPSNNGFALGSGDVYASANQTIDLRLSASWTAIGSGSFFSINRISGPAVVTATESVNCAYGLTTDVTPAGNSNVKYDTKQFDSHNAYSTSTGNFTAPTSGKYRVSIQSEVATTTTNFLLAKNGTQVTFLVTSDAGSVRSSSATISLNQGDTLSIQVGGVVGTVKGVSSGVFQNYLSIERIGN